MFFCVKIVREVIKKSVIVEVKDLEEVVKFSNEYVLEYLILYFEKVEEVVVEIENVGSVFVGFFFFEL